MYITSVYTTYLASFPLHTHEEISGSQKHHVQRRTVDVGRGTMHKCERIRCSLVPRPSPFPLGTMHEGGRPGDEATSMHSLLCVHARMSVQYVCMCTCPSSSSRLSYVAAHDVSDQAFPPLIFLCVCVCVKGEGLGTRLYIPHTYNE